MKRATQSDEDAISVIGISIHALVKRATGVFIFKWEVVPNFNPRPREEGDYQLILDTVTAKISIHALVKRATTVNKLRSIS